MRCGAVRCGAVRCGAVLGMALAFSIAWSIAEPYHLTGIDYTQSERLTSASVYPTEYSAIEFPGGAPGVAWRRTLAPKHIKVDLTYVGPYEHDATVTIPNGAFVSASGPYPAFPSPSSFNVHFTPGGTVSVEFDLTGLPNFVTLGNLLLELNCNSSYTNLNTPIGTRLYLTDSTPLGSPYGLQVPVWTNVLEDACLWATGQTGVVNCRWWCTFKLFHSLVFVYDTTNTPGGTVVNDPTYVVWHEESDPATRSFRLKQFFIDRGVPPSMWVNGDCQDVSTYLQIALSAIGVPGITGQITIPPFQNSQIWRTNRLCPIGSDAILAANYVNYRFGMHQIVSPATISIYDATIAQWMDSSGSSYQNPPMDWAFGPYWQVDHRPTIIFGSGFYGQAKGYLSSPLAGSPVAVYPLLPVYLNFLKND